MIKRAVFTSMVAAQFLAISAVYGPASRPDGDVSRGPAKLASLTDMRTDDPVPCPDCGAESGPAQRGGLTDMRADDPVPCPDCGAESGPAPRA